MSNEADMQNKDKEQTGQFYEYSRMKLHHTRKVISYPEAELPGDGGKMARTCTVSKLI